MTFDHTAFFAKVRSGRALGPTLSPGEVAGCEAILSACEGMPASWAAYCLATATVETAGTMQPIKEYGGNAYFTRRYDVAGDNPTRARQMGNVRPGDGAKYCGRGYVQLTWQANYEKAAQKLGEPLLSDPDLAMRPAIAARIMREGMEEGWFTGRKLTMLPPTASVDQFTEARRIINGRDRAGEIAEFATEYQSALLAGGWS